eukprot:403359325
MASTKLLQFYDNKKMGYAAALSSLNSSPLKNFKIRRELPKQPTLISRPEQPQIQQASQQLRIFTDADIENDREAHSKYPPLKIIQVKKDVKKAQQQQVKSFSTPYGISKHNMMKKTKNTIQKSIRLQEQLKKKQLLSQEKDLNIDAEQTNKNKINAQQQQIDKINNHNFQDIDDIYQAHNQPLNAQNQAIVDYQNSAKGLQQLSSVNTAANTKLQHFGEVSGLEICPLSKFGVKHCDGSKDKPCEHLLMSCQEVTQYLESEECEKDSVSNSSVDNFGDECDSDDLDLTEYQNEKDFHELTTLTSNLQQDNQSQHQQHKKIGSKFLNRVSLEISSTKSKNSAQNSARTNRLMLNGQYSQHSLNVKKNVIQESEQSDMISNSCFDDSAEEFNFQDMLQNNQDQETILKKRENINDDRVSLEEDNSNSGNDASNSMEDYNNDEDEDCKNYKIYIETEECDLDLQDDTQIGSNLFIQKSSLDVKNPLTKLRNNKLTYNQESNATLTAEQILQDMKIGSYQDDLNNQERNRKITESTNIGSSIQNNLNSQEINQNINKRVRKLSKYDSFNTKSQLSKQNQRQVPIPLLKLNGELKPTQKLTNIQVTGNHQYLTYQSQSSLQHPTHSMFQSEMLNNETANNLEIKDLNGIQINHFRGQFLRRQNTPRMIDLVTAANNQSNLLQQNTNIEPIVEQTIIQPNNQQNTVKIISSIESKQKPKQKSTSVLIQHKFSGNSLKKFSNQIETDQLQEQIPLQDLSLISEKDSSNSNSIEKKISNQTIASHVFNNLQLEPLFDLQDQEMSVNLQRSGYVSMKESSQDLSSIMLNYAHINQISPIKIDKQKKEEAKINGISNEEQALGDVRLEMIRNQIVTGNHSFIGSKSKNNSILVDQNKKGNSNEYINNNLQSQQQPYNQQFDYNIIRHLSDYLKFNTSALLSARSGTSNGSKQKEQLIIQLPAEI